MEKKLEMDVEADLNVVENMQGEGWGGQDS